MKKSRDDQTGRMYIGIDFDNTIVNYDGVFNLVALEKGLIPETLPKGKVYVRDFLRKINKEDQWTLLQGSVYGSRLSEARPFDGFKAFIQYCDRSFIPYCIVSHKTRYPYVGPKWDLRDAARQWLANEGIVCDVYFESTKKEKVERIKQLGCSHFVDDLPEFYGMNGFPEKLVKILFNPKGKCSQYDIAKKIVDVSSWEQMLSMMIAGQLKSHGL